MQTNTQLYHPPPLRLSPLSPPLVHPLHNFPEHDRLLANSPFKDNYYTTDDDSFEEEHALGSCCGRQRCTPGLEHDKLLASSNNQFEEDDHSTDGDEFDEELVSGRCCGKRGGGRRGRNEPRNTKPVAKKGDREKGRGKRSKVKELKSAFMFGVGLLGRGGMGLRR